MTNLLRSNTLTANSKLSLLKTLVRLSYCLLIFVLAANLWAKGHPTFIYVLVLFPLAMFAPGIWTDNQRTLIWMGFVLLLYFAGAVFGVAKPEPSALDIAELTLIVFLFCVAMFYARFRQTNPELTAE